MIGRPVALHVALSAALHAALPVAQLVALFLLAAGLPHARPASATEARPLFAKSEMLQLTIKAPFGAIARGRADPDRLVAGTLVVAGASPETLEVTLAPRGITRRRQDICPFPPLRVAFPAKPPGTSMFKGQKRLKLVTHCRPEADFQQHILLEYAAYRLFNLLTPASFNARLASISYVDEKGRPIATRAGFFIEDADDMASRTDANELEVQARLASSQFNPRDAVRYALFQYLIGNLDWGMNAGPAGADCCHNSRPIGARGATTGLTPVPYDFDSSGLVNAPYAVPPAGINVSSVRIRRYRGFCRHNAELPAAIADLANNRASLLAVLAETPQLDARAQRQAAAYLDTYFEAAAAPDFAAKLAKSCL